jgi:hypothetical protein
MGQMIRTRLVNLLARTTSEHDGEALTATRMANQLLAQRGLAWSEVIPDDLAPPATQPTPAAENAKKAVRPDGLGDHVDRAASAMGASRHTKSRHRPSVGGISLRPAPIRRIGRVSLWLGLGSRPVNRFHPIPSAGAELIVMGGPSAPSFRLEFLDPF